jgi:hypothetical protein
VRCQVRRGSRGRQRAGFALALVVTAMAATLCAGSPPGDGDDLGPPAEPVALAADQVRYWDDGPVRWVVLEGQAAILQGTEGLRGARAVARITPLDDRATGGYRIEAYAEDGRAARRAEIQTRAEVRIRSHREGQLVRQEGPNRDRALWLRAFPDAGRPARPPAPSEAPPAMQDQPLVDPGLRRTQFDGDAFSDLPPLDIPAEADDTPPVFGVPNADPTPDLGAPGPNEEDLLVPPSEMPAAPIEEMGPAPRMPGSRRSVTIGPRDSGGTFSIDARPASDGSGQTMIIIRGGVNLTAEQPGQGTIDLSADSAVIWTRVGGPGLPGAGPQQLEQTGDTPFEVYLEGNVIFRQDERKVAGNGDQKTVRARQFYIDLRTQWFVAYQAEMDLFDARLLAPIRTFGEEIRQYRPILGRGEKGLLFGPAQIRAERTLITGSRFPEPGYRFQSRSIDLFELDAPLLGPDGKPVANPKDPNGPGEKVYRIDARQNLYKIGPVPVFYWPRVVTDSDDLDPPLRQIQFRANNYFGQQLLTDWSMFKLLGIKRPDFIDNWNFDVDYLSYRGVALGTELGWSGRDLFGNIADPYHRIRDGRAVDRPYWGYFDIWGLRDWRDVDTLGPGPAVITVGPPGAGKKGFQRDADPSFQDFRGRIQLRHMQSLLPSDAPFDEDFRLQLEAAYNSDRNFLEQYYKRLFDSGLDEVTLAYLIYQRENRALSLLTQGNLQYWYTDSQTFPRLDYYRLGDSLFGGLLSYSQNSGVDYANIHTATEVNNPDIFAFLPFDPVSATSGPLRTGRLWTSHMLELPLDLTYLRVVPYAQGQLVGWDNQFQTALPSSTLVGLIPEQDFIRGPAGSLLGRAWGGVGARANVMAWRNFPGVESELLNVHGLSHKINFDADFRTTYSNVPLNRIGITDTLDDNTYEWVRRYFALTNYRGGILPAQYDPRFLTLRRTISPITGTVDVQDDMETLQLALRQRLQTKRGPDGRRRIIDWMTFDLSTTYFPQADRDNFGKPFGQNQYNWEWFIGDRTSITSSGWFEFFDITGQPILISNPRHTSDPFGLKVINTGISLARPPRGNIFIGYAVINTGVISTSALNVAFSYWLSPKWYGSFATSYDFGNAILLGSTFGITRIGADFLTSVGLTVDPQRQSYMFGFELTPRLSPSVRLGSGGGAARFDPRWAPMQ